MEGLGLNRLVVDRKFADIEGYASLAEYSYDFDADIELAIQSHRNRGRYSEIGEFPVNVILETIQLAMGAKAVGRELWGRERTLLEDRSIPCHCYLGEDVVVVCNNSACCMRQT